MFSRFFSEESVFFSLFDIKQPRIIEYFGVTQFGTFYVKNYLRNRLPDGSLTYLPVGHRLGLDLGTDICTKMSTVTTGDPYVI